MSARGGKEGAIMCKRISIGWLAALLLVGSAAAAAAGLTVKYRSAATVYLDGGSAQGLAVGDRLLVVAKGATVAELEVVYVAEQSASCRVVSENRAVAAGDQVVAMKKDEPQPRPPAPRAVAEEPALKTALPVYPATPPPWARYRGGVSFGYYRFADSSPSNFDFSQSTARADFSLWELGGKPYSVNLRWRGRNDTRAVGIGSLVPQTQRDDRLYELSLIYDPPQGRLGFEVGRVGISRFVGIGYLDGGLVRLRLHSGVDAGGFGGRNSDIFSSSFHGAGAKYGGFLRLFSQDLYGPHAAEGMVAFTREFALGAVSREYLSLESRFGSGRPWSVFERAEIDLNRGWRKDLSASSTQISNLTFATTYRFAATGSATVSYDRHQNYRTYLNRSVPEQFFDDLLRQGLRLSMSYGVNQLTWITGSAGVRFKERDTASNSVSFSGGVRREGLLPWHLSLGADAVGYSNSYTRGYQISARTGKRFVAGHQLDLSLGSSLYTLKLGEERRRSTWLRLFVRAELGQGVYVLSDVEYATGDDRQGPGALLELGYAF